MKNAALITALLALAGVIQLALLEGPSWQPLVAAAGLLTIAWLISLPLKNAGVIDIFWGPAIALVAWVSVLAYERPFSAPTWLLLALVTAWALRLAIHLARRNIGAPEDFRYAAFRRQAGRGFWLRSLVTIFWLQAALAWVVAAPLIGHAASASEASLGLLQYVGAAIFLFGFAFEWVADAQLRAFKADPDNQGEVLDSGLWGLTRHPNYFGEAVLWWGIYVASLDIGGGLFIVGPVLITWMLMRFSGVAMLEDGLKETKPKYADYVESTPAFFPRLLPR
ncbi:MAG: DUF1295 domain-containing protein [Xanthomonadales bacterium]|nr:DUF1295 domain-containing protein [Xanthomonadales bacterium]